MRTAGMVLTGVGIAFVSIGVGLLLGSISSAPSCDASDGFPCLNVNANLADGGLVMTALGTLPTLPGSTARAPAAPAGLAVVGTF